jgi:hypothetical protein
VISWSSLNIGYLGHTAQIWKKLINTRVYILSPNILEIDQRGFSYAFLGQDRNRHLGSKTRSHSPNIDKPCLHSRGYCLSRITLEIGQKRCFDDF